MGKLVGQILKLARLQRGLSQNDLALKLSLRSPQSISNIERGVSPLPRSMIPAMSEILMLDKKELVEALIEETRQKYWQILKIAPEAIPVETDESFDEE